MKSLLHLGKYIRPRLGAIAAGMVFSVVAAISSAAVAVLLKPMFNDVFFVTPATSPAAESPV